MMAPLKPFNVTLTVVTQLSGEVLATSSADAMARARILWTETNPHPFDEIDEDLVRIDAEEVRP